MEIEGTGNYGGKYTKTFSIQKATPVIVFENSAIVKKYGDPSFVNNLPKSILEGEVRYTSDNPQVTTVDETSGTVTIKNAGTTVIRVKIAEGRNYRAGEAAYDLNIQRGEKEIKLL